MPATRLRLAPAARRIYSLRPLPRRIVYQVYCPRVQYENLNDPHRDPSVAPAYQNPRALLRRTIVTICTTSLIASIQVQHPHEAFASARSWATLDRPRLVKSPPISGLGSSSSRPAPAPTPPTPLSLGALARLLQETIIEREVTQRVHRMSDSQLLDALDLLTETQDEDKSSLLEPLKSLFRGQPSATQSAAPAAEFQSTTQPQASTMDPADPAPPPPAPVPASPPLAPPRVEEDFAAPDPSLPLSWSELAAKYQDEVQTGTGSGARDLGRGPADAGDAPAPAPAAVVPSSSGAGVIGAYRSLNRWAAELDGGVWDSDAGRNVARAVR